MTNVTVLQGDCRDLLFELDDESVDAIITDPPYELAFMGKTWDAAGIAFTPAIWEHCYHILKPGGYLLSFGGTRTWHRLACAIEDAGFEIRDSIAWLYVSGFPKSLDVSKAIDKAAGAQREVIGSQRLTGNALIPTRDKGGTYGVGVGVAPPGDIPLTAPATDAAKQWQGWGTTLKPAFEPIIVARKPFRGTVAANVLAHGTGVLNIDACRVNISTEYDPSKCQRLNPAGRWPSNVVLDDSQAAELDKQSGNCPGFAGGNGGASRFFPTFRYTAKAPRSERPTVDGITHPTMKPLKLMRWLVRLVTPPNGLVLDPFAGSGTTGEACILENVRCILIENDPTYIPLIEHRLTRNQ